MARDQVLRRTDWIFFAHLSLVRAQAILPVPFRRPYAVLLYGIEAWGPLSDGQRDLLRRARLRLAISNFTAARVMERHPDIGDVVACPLGMPPAHDERQDPANDGAHDLQEPLSDAVVLIVGRMLAAERYKGHDQLIEAWPYVLQQVPEAQLVIAGSGDDAGRLQARAADVGAGESVRFIGFVGAATLSALYERCAVFVMPSRGEGFGLVYLEAMAHKRPCIGSRQDAAAEIIVDGETGLLVDQHDIRGLGEAIVRLLRDPTLRTAMGAAGFRRLHERFSPDQFSNRLVALLRQAFEASGPNPSAI